jgi:2-polyprenyl-3-methyl-5-hydroxy-6-metoxy-1,4-benzoquinol methylase
MNKTNVKKELKKTIEKIERGVKDIKIWCEDDGTGGSDCGYDCDEVLKQLKKYKQNKQKCPFCKSKNVYFKRSVISKINKKRYYLYDCRNCYLTFFTPLKFEDIYETAKDKRYENRHKGKTKISPSSDKACGILRKYLKYVYNKKILDIGASNCVNFLSLKRYYKLSSDNYYALELDRKALKIGEKIGVKNIIPQYFDKNILKKIKNKFDIILATEILEHQVNPKEFIETGLKLLKENGLFVITIPNKNKFFMRLREQPTDVPPHHFLKLGKKFFLKNFINNLIYLEDFHNRQSTFKETSLRLSKKIFNTKKWILVTPLTCCIRLLQIFDKIKGDRLLVIIKKNSAQRQKMNIKKMIKELDKLYPQPIFDDLKMMVKLLAGFIETEGLDKTFYDYLDSMEKNIKEAKDGKM